MTKDNETGLDFEEKLLLTLRCGFHRIARKQDKICTLLETMHVAQAAQMDIEELSDAMEMIQASNDKKICNHIEAMEDNW